MTKLQYDSHFSVQCLLQSRHSHSCEAYRMDMILMISFETIHRPMKVYLYIYYVFEISRGAISLIIRYKDYVQHSAGMMSLLCLFVCYLGISWTKSCAIFEQNSSIVIVLSTNANDWNYKFIYFNVTCKIQFTTNKKKNTNLIAAISAASLSLSLSLWEKKCYKYACLNDLSLLLYSSNSVRHHQLLTYGIL